MKAGDRSFGRLVVAALCLAALLVAGAWIVFARYVVPEPTPAPVIPAPTARPAAGLPAPVDDEPATTVARVQGVAERSSGAQGWVRVAVGDRLAADELLRTGAGGRVDLQVGDESSRLTVPEGTELRIAEVTRAAHRLRLNRGRVVVDFQPKGERLLRIESEHGSAETRGARFTMLSTGTAVAVAAEKGKVNLSAAGSTVEVVEGTQAVAVAGAAPSAPEPIPVEALLKVALLAAQRDSCLAMEGHVRPGTELTVDGQSVEVAGDGSFKLQVPREEGRSEVVLQARDPGGALRRESFACRAPIQRTKPPPDRVRIDWNAEP